MIVRSTRTRGRAAVLSVGRTLKHADGTGKAVDLLGDISEVLRVDQILGRVLLDNRLDSRSDGINTPVEPGDDIDWLVHARRAFWRRR